MSENKQDRLLELGTVFTSDQKLPNRTDNQIRRRGALAATAFTALAATGVAAVNHATDSDRTFHPEQGNPTSTIEIQVDDQSDPAESVTVDVEEAPAGDGER